MVRVGNGVGGGGWCRAVTVQGRNGLGPNGVRDNVARA